ncbi:MAG: T9SS type A sorting domain-containing protein [candidate division WOR-3 bacterium]|nr:MAG: T9SS type A sorting domain-containing protein [candidate division WOR-3 bacterium]UCF05600.1 MAG: T9SS type A sorting domain-containing protein [bacterium]
MQLRYKSPTSIYLILLIFAAAGLRAGFIANGIAVCTATGGQLNHRVASDGYGGAVITWEDERLGAANSDIYSQRITLIGDTLWREDGEAVCVAAGNQRSPQIIPDGPGGALIAWEDQRAGNSDIYGQKIDQNGLSQWMADGVALSTAAGAQIAPRIAPDGSGGAIVVWEDRRAGGNNRDIYAQRVGAAGNALWTANGVAICANASAQQYPEIVSDGLGGAIITWQDRRNGGNNRDIYAQRIDSSGSVLWTVDGVGICMAAGQQTLPKIVSDGSGGAIITWLDGGTAIYAQRVDTAGAVQWAVDGVAVCPASSFQEEPAMISDGAGGAVLVWPDTRSGNYDIYAQRINASGVRQWGDGGVGIAVSANDEYSPQQATDGAGGAVIAYELHGPTYDDYDIYVQHVDSGGNLMWVPGGVGICTAAMHQSNPQMVSDDAGGALIAWYDERNGDPDIYAARIDALGMHVASVLQNYYAYVDESSITIQWVLSGIREGTQFYISRAEGADSVFEELLAPEISMEYSFFTFIDEGCEPGHAYRYRVEMQNQEGRSVLFETDQLSVPLIAVTLEQNHPNPFNPSTTIKYYLKERAHVILDIYDVSGKRIVCLVDREETNGSHVVEWNGRDERGNLVSTGVYFYRLTAGRVTRSRKMILVK